MHRHSSVGRVDNFESKPRNETGAFARAILGRAISRGNLLRPDGHAERETLEHLAHYSPRHAHELRTLKSADAENRRQRDLLEWCAQVSTESEQQLRNILWEEAEARHEATHRERTSRAFFEGEWDASKHPRGGYPENPGWFSPTEGGGNIGGGDAGDVGTRGDFFAADMPAGDSKGTPQPRFDAKNPYHPSPKKGTWTGKPGNSAFRFHNPIRLESGQLVREIPYKFDAAILDDFVYPGESPTIVLTGNAKKDRDLATKTWKKLNPGKKLPHGYVFHHDMLRVREEIVEIGGKKTKVIVGQLQLIPAKINSVVHHQGSLSITKRVYDALKNDESAVGKFALEEVENGGKKIVSKSKLKIRLKKLSNGLIKYVGRPIKAFIPFLSSGLALIEFPQNVEAHGLVGAGLRATPMLGDVLAAYDLGSELAKQITDEANAKADAALAAANAIVSAAWERASQQAVEAYNELAAQIEIRREYGHSGPLVDPNRIIEAIKIYHSRMHTANLLEATNAKDFDYDASAAEAKQELKRLLIEACQDDEPSGIIPPT